MEGGYKQSVWLFLRLKNAFAFTNSYHTAFSGWRFPHSRLQLSCLKIWNCFRDLLPKNTVDGYCLTLINGKTSEDFWPVRILASSLPELSDSAISVMIYSLMRVYSWNLFRVQIVISSEGYYQVAPGAAFHCIKDDYPRFFGEIESSDRYLRAVEAVVELSICLFREIVLPAPISIASYEPPATKSNLAFPNPHIKPRTHKFR